MVKTQKDIAQKARHEKSTKLLYTTVRSGVPMFIPGNQDKQNTLKGDSEMVEMKISAIISAPKLDTTILVLLEPQQKKVLPISIGSMEGNAIALGIKKVATPRPMSHDLMKNILEEFQVQIIKVVITELRDDTFYAVIHLVVDGEELQIDSRPSDAIALAIRAEAPIYCTEKLLKTANELGLLRQDRDIDDSESLQRWLEELKPKDFGKYKM
jgi:bifunctional DNase/RNase